MKWIPCTNFICVEVDEEDNVEDGEEDDAVNVALGVSCPTGEA